MALNTSKCNHPMPLPFKGLRRAIFTGKVGQTELVFGVHDGSYVGLCTQN